MLSKATFNVAKGDPSMLLCVVRNFRIRRGTAPYAFFYSNYVGVEAMM
jgi:hypothetical protein